MKSVIRATADLDAVRVKSRPQQKAVEPVAVLVTIEALVSMLRETSQSHLVSMRSKSGLFSFTPTALPEVCNLSSGWTEQ